MLLKLTFSPCMHMYCFLHPCLLSLSLSLSPLSLSHTLPLSIFLSLSPMCVQVLHLFFSFTFQTHSTHTHTSTHPTSLYLSLTLSYVCASVAFLLKKVTFFSFHIAKHMYCFPHPVFSLSLSPSLNVIS